ncbi:MAG: hypothetical protein JOS17DRAFT_396037 [Linnemannia elongata]|nr:MAG: hypothetical protein JOS17DRAFT_396037 [Linnemannia elongata]
MQQADITQEHVLGFRSVHKRQSPSTTSVPLVSPEVVHIDCYTDPDTNNDFVFWEDIQQAFNEALSVRNRTKMLLFLREVDYKALEPRRIAAVPNVVLDVIVGEESTAAEVTILERIIQGLSLYTPPQSPPSRARRNPTCGDVLQAIQNYSHMDASASISPLQEPQAVHDKRKVDIRDAPTRARPPIQNHHYEPAESSGL